MQVGKAEREQPSLYEHDDLVSKQKCIFFLSPPNLGREQKGKLIPELSTEWVKILMDPNGYFEQ